MAHSFDKFETIPESQDVRSIAARSLRGQQRLGLVILWNSDEPHSIGAWVPVAQDSAAPWVFGRGPNRAGDTERRLVAFQQRAHEDLQLPPLASPSLSRRQLLIRCNDADQLEVTNVGRRALLVNGSVAQHQLVRVGDIIELGGKLVFLCTQRPRMLDDFPLQTYGTFPFGAADPHGFVGESPAAWNLRADIAFAASHTGHVLVYGGSGTGKELVANAVHRLSNRPGPLVSRNAATIPETLIDAELFGNMRGYPNPGMPERKGLLGEAHTGTLFLDEFGDLPLSAQAHVLRVLDSGEYHRLGEPAARRSEFKLIAATNRPLSLLRDDIVARFAFRINMPGLAQRPEDVPLLARHLLDDMTSQDPELCKQLLLANGLPRLGAGFVRQLTSRPYATNVRELRNLLWRSVAASRGEYLRWPVASALESSQLRTGEANDDLLRGAQLQSALDANNGSIEKTWRALGLANRHALNRLVQKYGLSVTRHPGR